MTDKDRRHFLTAAPLGLAATAPGLAPAQADDKKDKKKDGEGDVGPTEDLMREHGMLNRVLLVYEEGLRRLRAKEEIPPQVFRSAATLVRTFVEDHHERVEETFIFPAFQKKQVLTDLVKVLKRQHDAGRKLTDVILRESADDRFKLEEGRKAVVAACEAFIRMYRPHEAREDTVLFPAVPQVLSAREIKEVGERAEEEEHKLIGKDGFAKLIEQVAGFEKKLGIHDLDQFTPKFAND